MSALADKVDIALSSAQALFGMSEKLARGDLSEAVGLASFFGILQTNAECLYVGQELFLHELWSKLLA